MKMESPVPLECPDHRERLHPTDDGARYACRSGCSFPVVQGIPRFVPSTNYAASFGLQWNRYRKTQLDSFTGLAITRDRLTRLAGGSLEFLKGKSVLEVGCGAGRFTEILLASGARVFATDISDAVEANHANCGGSPGYFVCQADLRSLPVAPGQFDVVVCIGVVQHTPCPEDTIGILCAQLKEGGLLVMDHYTYGYAVTASRKWLRALLLRSPPAASLAMCRGLVAALWPVHRLLWRAKSVFPFGWLRRGWIRLSPVVDYHGSYPQLGPELLKAWATLDTHDTLTDVYKHLRSREEIEEALRRFGMERIETAYAGNGVEARARAPYKGSRQVPGDSA
ncbi:MAG TPA: class I SAM-dependent methyltransferase [Candidatus Deferrimicrobiaceae bacterium]